MGIVTTNVLIKISSADGRPAFGWGSALAAIKSDYKDLAKKNRGGAVNMKNSDFRLRKRGVFLLAVLLVSASHAQIYKWVDTKGQTHYSSRKDDAAGAKTDEVKLPPQPAPSAMPKPATDAGKFPSRPAPEAQAGSSAAPKPVKSVSGGKEDGTDASRCALARDVLNGSLRHGNGKPTDKYDTDIAQNDVRLFCR